MCRSIVLLISDVGLGAEALESATQKLVEADARVLIAGQARVEPPSRVVTADVRDVVGAARGHGPAFRRAVQRAAPREKMWVHIRNDPWVTWWLPHLDVVVGLDPGAATAAQHLVGDRSRPVVATSVEQAIAALEHAPGPPSVLDPHSPPIDERRHLAEVSDTAGPAVLQRLREAVAGAISSLEAGDDAGAAAILHAALEGIDSPRLRADVLGDVASWGLAHGRQVGLAHAAFAAELAVADAHLRAGRHDPAASSFMEALRTGLSPVLHMQQRSSPLASDPVGYMAPLRASEVAAVLRGERGRPAARAPKPTPRPRRRTRLLIAVQTDDSFLREIVEHFAASADVDVRLVHFADARAVHQFAKRQAPLVAEVLRDGDALKDALDESFSEHLDWADVAFVEWCSGLAALLSRAERHDTRLIVRLHSYEAFNFWPHLVDFANVDDVVFVSEHLRDHARAAIPGLSMAAGPRLWVVPNAVRLFRFVQQKEDDARFTLGVVGASRVVKDPRWAVAVLRELRRHDERYSLHLVRGVMDDGGVATRDYAAALSREIAELPEGAVTVSGHTDDLPSVLRDVGVVLSSSIRESFHIGFVEAVASGAVPVVRDWPYFPGAAAHLFPPDWVVDSPAAAAERVLAHTLDPVTWRRSTAEAADHVLSTWDWGVVSHQYDQLVLAGSGRRRRRPG